jgi:hypothetical protein
VSEPDVVTWRATPSVIGAWLLFRAGPPVLAIAFCAALLPIGQGGRTACIVMAGVIAVATVAVTLWRARVTFEPGRLVVCDGLRTMSIPHEEIDVITRQSFDRGLQQHCLAVWKRDATLGIPLWPSACWVRSSFERRLAELRGHLPADVPYDSRLVNCGWRPGSAARRGLR